MFDTYKWYSKKFLRSNGDNVFSFNIYLSLWKPNFNLYIASEFYSLMIQPLK